MLYFSSHCYCSGALFIRPSEFTPALIKKDNYLLEEMGLTHLQLNSLSLTVSLIDTVENFENHSMKFKARAA
jgi:hypothetical protein